MKPLLITFISLLIADVDQSQKLRHQKRLRENQSIDDIKDKLNNKALTINYPLDFFSSSTLSNWRAKAIYDKNFVTSNEASKIWIDFSKAQDGEDIWLYENWFYGMTNGVIMESGALDGILFSNSYMFESFANWTSINVEADPENYHNLISNRNQAININCALCSESSLLHYSSEGVIPVRGFVEFMSPTFLKKWHKNYYNNRTKLNDLPTYPCVTVTSLLHELNIRHIDIWILDTEGAEESVLKGTDFNKIHFNAVAMECDEHDVIKNARKTNILERNGFTCHLIERNCMCKHNDYIPSEIENKSVLKKWDGVKWTGGYKGEITGSSNSTKSSSDIIGIGWLDIQNSNNNNNNAGEINKVNNNAKAKIGTSSNTINSVTQPVVEFLDTTTASIITLNNNNHNIKHLPNHVKGEIFTSTISSKNNNDVEFVNVVR